MPDQQAPHGIGIALQLGEVLDCGCCFAVREDIKVRLSEDVDVRMKEYCFIVTFVTMKLVEIGEVVFKNPDKPDIQSGRFLLEAVSECLSLGLEQKADQYQNDGRY